MLLPSVSYYGERIFVENQNLGYLLAESRSHELNAVFALGYEHMFFNRWSVGNFTLASGGRATPILDSGSEFNSGSEGQEPTSPDSGDDAPAPAKIDLERLHDRNLAVLAGLDYRLYAEPFFLSVQALQDISHVHDGRELRIGGSYEWQRQKHLLTTSAGFLWQDDKALNYYYGVRSDEVDDESLVYSASSGSSPFVRIDWHYQLNRRWTWQTSLHYRVLSDAAVNSPLVEENDVISVFTGGVYRF